MLKHLSSFFTPSDKYPFKKLQQKKKDLILYSAGSPQYKSVFTRDSILSGILSRDAVMLRDQLSYNALYQGVKRNPITGEEPGKIFHQNPGKKMRGLNTDYNACDATALFLIGHEMYLHLTNDRNFSQKHQRSIGKASEYILSHLQKDFFVESPVFSNATKFALHVTYWKDSMLPARSSGEPDYPIIYTLAHVMNMRALRSAAFLLSADILLKKAQKMQQALDTLWDDSQESFIVAMDQKGMIQGVSSDSLHILFYLNTHDITKEKVAKIVSSSSVLETACGYQTFDHRMKNLDSYHTETVWPFENALIHAAAVKFGLRHVEEVSKRVTKHLDSFPELFVHTKNDKWKKGGNTIQLWTIAAKKYFDTCV